ncbi:MAG: ferredoxin [Anaerolineaceae bacterium]|nr:ferredoxin [Anaerolineaceae bacterium]
MTKIVDIEGIGEKYGQKMMDAGVRTVEALLKQGATKKGRKDLAEKTGFSESQLLSWVNFADMYRIKGIGSEYSQLLEIAGVDSVPELAQRKPENLHKKMDEVNAEKKLVRQLPSLKMVETWVMQAKSLPKVVTH